MASIEEGEMLSIARVKLPSGDNGSMDSAASEELKNSVATDEEDDGEKFWNEEVTSASAVEDDGTSTLSNPSHTQFLKPPLQAEQTLKVGAAQFSDLQSQFEEAVLFGCTDQLSW